MLNHEHADAKICILVKMEIYLEFCVLYYRLSPKEKKRKKKYVNLMLVISGFLLGRTQVLVYKKQLIVLSIETHAHTPAPILIICKENTIKL